MELLIITGLSGAGKSRAADVCEDLGYYCVDNLPPALLGRFAALCLATHGRYERVALVIDVRSVADYGELDSAFQELEGLDCPCRILYLEAEQAALIRRYKESRRPHPMSQPGCTIQQAVEREQAFLAPLRQRADLIIDTTGLSLNRLQARIREALQPEAVYFAVNVCSFGYKYGIPPEADLVFDVRCLPNPFYEADLRDLNGLDDPVSDYVFRNENAQVLLAKLTDLLAFLLPLYQFDRSELTVAVGCTGGHHRSVAMAAALGHALSDEGYTVAVSHRDMER
ncbi:MAG: RNase adapter RapZ [Oscillospiraceae bacterium]|nr:RNase adapter RapZ [Oscillospiraceae bacterium]